MDIKGILTKWKQFVVKMNDKGVPLPMVRDPNTLEGSVSLTLVVFSTTLVVVGILSKWAGFLGGVDMNAAFNFFYASTTLYFGHSWVHKEDTAKPAVTPPPAAPKSDDPDA